MNKCTWVIGGTSGIGKATAELLAQGGRAVYATGCNDVDVREVREIAMGWENFEGYLFADGTIPTQVEIVYSAGVNQLQHIGQMDDDAAFNIFDTNFHGFVRLIDFLWSEKIRNVKLVAITSDAAVRPMRTSLNYCASKAALNMAIRVAARELAERGWRVNGVAPGMTDGTLMTEYIDRAVPEIRGWSAEETYQYEMKQAVIKRRALPEEIAETVQFILDGPDYLNGEIITVNGGR